MAVIKDNLAVEVAGLAEETADTVIPDGQVWEVFEFVGAAAYLDDTAACLIWDPAGSADLLACTHGDGTYEPEFACTGDGTKVLRISLQNDTNQPRVLSGSWKARRIF
jgi:hypothetical protein